MNKPTLAILVTLLISHASCAVATGLPSVTAANALTGAQATTTNTAAKTVAAATVTPSASTLITVTPPLPTFANLGGVNKQSTIASVVIGSPLLITPTTPTSLKAAPVAAPVADVAPATPSRPVIVGGFSDVSFDLKCLAKILESGLFKLPMLTSNAKPVGFTTLKSQVTAGTTYQFDYAGTGFVARIKGTCQAWSNTISLDESSYTKV